MSKGGHSLWKLLWKALGYLVVTVSLSVVFYVIFALVFSTPEEKLLQRENRMYEKLYPALQEKEALLGGVIEGLQHKDNEIYRGLFYTEAPPALDPLDASSVIADSDTLSDDFFLSYGATKSETVMKMASRVDDNFRQIFDSLVEHRDSIPPLSLPVGNLSSIQTGATVGMKIHPFMKVAIRHDGLDLVAPQGEAVFAAADGKVVSVDRSTGGLGNIVEIDHGNGYRTRYGCLGEVSVSQGNKVKAGRKVGTVGISKGSFAPHLHYEVLHGGKVVDPINYFFASVTPETYAQMLFFSITTGQSMD